MFVTKNSEYQTMKIRHHGKDIWKIVILLLNITRYKIFRYTVQDFVGATARAVIYLYDLEKIYIFPSVVQSSYIIYIIRCDIKYNNDKYLWIAYLFHLKIPDTSNDRSLKFLPENLLEIYSATHWFVWFTVNNIKLKYRILIFFFFVHSFSTFIVV